MGTMLLLGEGKGCFAVDLGNVLLETSGDGGSGGIDKDGAAPIIDSIRLLLSLTGTTSSPNGSETVENVSTLRQITNEARCRALGWD